MNSLDTLLDIHRSFGYFKNDFDAKEKNENLKIYYAMDNDVYSFAIYPFEENIKYADLLSERNNDKEALKTRARHLALSIKYLSDRGSLYILPSHRLEYKKTLFYFHEKIRLMARKINPDTIEKEMNSIIMNINELIALFKDDEEAFKYELTTLAPLIFKLLHFKSKFGFLTEQMEFFNKDNKINHFEDLLDEETDELVFTNTTNLDIEDSIKSHMINNKSELTLYNDVQAFKTVIAFNQLYKDEKKLILLTGDNSVLKTYETYEDAIEDDMGIIRHTKYLIPFISEPDSELYCESNRLMLEDIDSLLDNFIDSLSDNNGTLPALSRHVVEDLKNILSTEYIQKTLSTLQMQSTKITNDNFNFIEALYNKNNFFEYIKNVYQSFLNDIKSSLSLSYASNEIFMIQDDLEDIKYFHRYPFILCLEDNRQQKLFTKFISHVTKENKVNNILIEMDEIFPLHTIYAVTAIVLIYVNKYEQAKEYLGLAKKELENKPEQDYIKAEIDLLNLFLMRISITDETYSDTLKDFNMFLEQSNKVAEGQRIRAKIGKCSLELAHCYMQYFSKEEQVQSADSIFSDLDNIYKKQNDIFSHRPFILERASIQLYINIASIYILKKYFLKEKYEEVNIFLKKNLERYEALFSDNRDIGIRKLLLGFLLFDFNKISRDRIIGIMKSLEVSDNLLEYEKERLKVLLDIVKDDRTSGIKISDKRGDRVW